jgi:hypothetical protein
MTPHSLHKIGSIWFTDGSEREILEDAEGRQFVEDNDEWVEGQWLPPADDALIVENQSQATRSP